MTSPEARPPSLADGGSALFAWVDRMRENNPVTVDEDGTWHVFRHADVHRIFTDHRTFSSDPGLLLPDTAEAVRGNMAAVDPPVHHRLRKLVSKAFTPKVVADLEPRIVTAADTLITAMAEHDAPDLIRDLAYALPVVVIGELIGIPPEDRTLYRSWADALLSGGGPREDGTSLTDVMETYLADLLGQRRRNPENDLFSALAHAEVDGERLADHEVLNFASLLLAAGHITTTMMLGNTVLSLHEFPAAETAVRRDRALLPGLLEEVLRHRPPIMRLLRITTTDVELGGVAIPARSMVTPWLLGANRDPRHYTDPTAFDPRPRREAHLAFGGGVHFCLGAPLARLEGRVVFDLLLDRFAEIRVRDGIQVGYPSPMIFGVRELPVELVPHPAVARSA
ncbi:cytochrome P450 [Amycolatopsis australiensis]|uniref:Cytochrome P450 n=1 Tax=Amycolatopsis australiensis TaxID=546364 RepID=A0A1K1SD54_9PSEU|nr:cytochrome P450 [Amycolatopsis australiensis]SFW82254.1 Cytochrome P450 [Amycolatopsis australiensis]